ncbi:MAG TPA: putative glycoside hydrolase [Herpetosiphonaceae bacterium]
MNPLPLCTFSTAPTNIPADQLDQLIRHLVLQRGNDDATVAKLRALGQIRPTWPKFYIIPEPESSPSFRDENTITAAIPTATPWTNGVIFSRDQFQREIHPNKAWFLHGLDGRRLAAVNGDSKNYFYDMDPGNKEWQEYFWTKVQNEYVERLGARSFEIDNCHLSLNKIKRDYGGCTEYTDDAAYRAAWAAFLKRGREILGPDVIILPNAIEGKNGAISKDDFLAAGIDGYLDEAAIYSWVDYDVAIVPASIIRNLLEMQRHVQAGVTVMASFRGTAAYSGAYAYALFCMFVGETASFRYIAPGAGYSTVAILPECKLELGQPRGPFVVIDGTTVQREFDHYLVKADLKNRTATYTPIDRADPLTQVQQALAALQRQHDDLKAAHDTTRSVATAAQAQASEAAAAAAAALIEAQRPIVIEATARRE